MKLDQIRKQWNEVFQAKDFNQVTTILQEDSYRQLLVQRGDQLCQHTFVFDHPWDMERCLIPHTMEKMQWNQVFNDDEEWTFMLNRFDYWSSLAKAGLIQQEERYFVQIKTFLFDWIDTHPVIEYSLSTRTLDTGIRIVNMIESAMFLDGEKKLSKQQIELIFTSIDQQMAYLKENYVEKYTLSNWGSIQVCGIIICKAIMQADPATDVVYQWALEELSTQMDIQIGQDGMLWEQSTMYHVEVLNNLLKVLYYTHFYDVPLPLSVHEKTEAMCFALMHVTMPNHEIETFGDSDRVNAQDIMTKGAMLFHNAHLKAMGTPKLDEDCLFQFGMIAQSWLDQTDITTPQQCCYQATDCGMITRRSDFSEQASWTMMTNGELGSGHGHSDNLHYSIIYHGVPFVIDPGRYTYREDHPVRVQLKSMEAHNTIILDDSPASIPDSSWTYKKFLRPLVNQCTDTAMATYLEGAIVTEDPTMTHVRKMILIHPSCWLICDEVYAQGEHSLTKRIQLDPFVQVTKQKELYKLTNDKTTLQYYRQGMEVQLEQGPCSLRYNELLTHTILTSYGKFKDKYLEDDLFFGENFTIEKAEVIQPGQGVMDSQRVSAWRFIQGDESWTAIIFHEQIYLGKKVLYCQGLALHNQACVIYQKGNHKQLLRLK